jgi:hypothetical protein
LQFSTFRCKIFKEDTAVFIFSSADNGRRIGCPIRKELFIDYWTSMYGRVNRIIDRLCPNKNSNKHIQKLRKKRAKETDP